MTKIIFCIIIPFIVENTGVESQSRFIDTARGRLLILAATIGAGIVLVAGGRCEAENQDVLPDSLCLENKIEQVAIVPPALEDTHSHEDVDSSQEHEPSKTFSIIHTVQKGESISSIADCYFAQGELGVESIAAANTIENLDVIFPGQKLTVNITAAQRISLDQPIDLDEFSRRTGYDSGIIKAINRLPNDNDQLVGILSIPRQRAVISDEDTETKIIKSGETLSSIAQKSGTGLLDLINLNDGNSPEDPDAIKPGNIILIPRTVLPKTGTGESPYQPPEVKLNQFIEQYKPIAQKVANERNIPVEVMLAQAVLETGYGESELAVQANNFFGMKAKDDWEGEVYIKVTPEEINPEELDNWPDATVIRELSNGRLLINVPQPFRKYETAEHSFVDYGKKIIESGNYNDAAMVGAENPEEYLAKLVDKNGPPYATDSSYYDKVIRVVNNIRVLEKEESAGVTIPETTEFASPESIPDGIMERINAAEFTLEGFENFVKGIDRSYMEFAASKPAFNNENGLSQKPFEFFTWHFTTLYVNADGSDTQVKSGQSDPKRLISSMNNRDGNTRDNVPGHLDGCCGVRWFIDRDGKVFQFTDSNQRVMHNPPYSEVSTGVEIEGVDQAGITPEQYEAGGYLALLELALQGKLTTGIDLSSLVVGHGEIREIARRDNPSLDVRSDFPREVSVALRDRIQKFINEPEIINRINQLTLN